jgi:ElaB/YqjD/DUF883 family membrane-anchored ribosome-binding protein
MSTATLPTATEQFRAKALEVKEDLRDVKNDLKELGALTPDLAREKMAQLAQSVERGKEKAADATCAVEEFIRERPLQSVLIAAGAGLLVGYLISKAK